MSSGRAVVLPLPPFLSACLCYLPSSLSSCSLPCCCIVSSCPYCPAVLPPKASERAGDRGSSSAVICFCFTLLRNLGPAAMSCSGLFPLRAQRSFVTERKATKTHDPQVERAQQKTESDKWLQNSQLVPLARVRASLEQRGCGAETPACERTAIVSGWPAAKTTKSAPWECSERGRGMNAVAQSP